MTIITARAMMMMMMMMIIQLFIFNMLTKYLQKSITESAQQLKLTFIDMRRKLLMDANSSSFTAT
jgi:hypothetical protein